MSRKVTNKTPTSTPSKTTTTTARNRNSTKKVTFPSSNGRQCDRTRLITKILSPTRREKEKVPSKNRIIDFLSSIGPFLAKNYPILIKDDFFYFSLYRFPSLLYRCSGSFKGFMVPQLSTTILSDVVDDVARIIVPLAFFNRFC
jgi:hypothetical protein